MGLHSNPIALGDGGSGSGSAIPELLDALSFRDLCQVCCMDFTYSRAFIAPSIVRRHFLMVLPSWSFKMTSPGAATRDMSGFLLHEGRERLGVHVIRVLLVADVSKVLRWVEFREVTRTRGHCIVFLSVFTCHPFIVPSPVLENQVKVNVEELCRG